MKFEVGDKVRVKDDFGDALHPFAQRWRGKTCTVTLTWIDGDCLLESAEGEKMWIHEAWLEPVNNSLRLAEKYLSAFDGALSMRSSFDAEIDKTLRPRHIYKGGRKLVVLWRDGTKTVVERAEGEPDSTYAAFTAALAIKIYGSNSRVRKIVETTEEPQKKKKKAQKEAQKGQKGEK